MAPRLAPRSAARSSNVWLTYLREASLAKAVWRRLRVTIIAAMLVCRVFFVNQRLDIGGIFELAAFVITALMTREHVCLSSMRTSSSSQFERVAANPWRCWFVGVRPRAWVSLKSHTRAKTLGRASIDAIETGAKYDSTHA